MDHPTACKEANAPKAVDAATKIQAGFRGYRVRKQYHHSTPHHAEPTGGWPNENVHIPQSEKHKIELNPADAATRIQAGYRGFRVRRTLHQEHPEQNDPHSACSASTTRVPITRERTEADKAAAKIQASFRGYMTRRALASNDAHDDTQTKTPLRTRNQNQYSVNQGSTTDSKLNNAATVIQAGFRGYHTRKALHKDTDYLSSAGSHGKENEQQAATRIQATYRGFRTRKKLKSGGSTYSPEIEHTTTGQGNKSPKVEDENEAATRIQAAFRGFSTRQRVHVPHSHSSHVNH